ncbi:hypothetical protein ACPUEJ_20015 [Vibrio tubiashii]|uniref:hypothetical protein n=1 Tax=Vibrio tubiashii TaxID=29498 RepID=UPI003CE591A1
MKFVQLVVFSFFLAGCSTPERDKMNEAYPKCVSKVLVTKDVLTAQERVCISNHSKFEEQERNIVRSEEMLREQERLEIERDAKRLEYLKSPEGIRELEAVNAQCNQIVTSYLSRNPDFRVHKKYDGEKQGVLYICNLVVSYETTLGNRYKEVNLLYNVDNNAYDVRERDF